MLCDRRHHTVPIKPNENVSSVKYEDVELIEGTTVNVILPDNGKSLDLTRQHHLFHSDYCTKCSHLVSKSLITH